MIIDESSSSKSYETELNRIIAAEGLNNTYYQPYFYPPSLMQRLVSGYDVNTDDAGLSKLVGKDTTGLQPRMGTGRGWDDIDAGGSYEVGTRIV
jgi:hypothetical protein